MPNAVNFKVGVGFDGGAAGVTGNTQLTTPIGPVAVTCNLLGTTKQIYAQWSVPLVIPTTGTTVLNLLSGLNNPLGETISGAGAQFSQVQAVFIQNGTTTGTLTVEAFGGTVGSQFQAALGTTQSVAVMPAQCVGFIVPANKTGWPVTATAKNIQLRNLGTTAATVQVIVIGNV